MTSVTPPAQPPEGSLPVVTWGNCVWGVWVYRTSEYGMCVSCFARRVWVYRNWMARPRMGSTAHTVPVTVKLSAREVEKVDRLRGRMGRSTYLRRLVQALDDRRPGDT